MDVRDVLAAAFREREFERASRKGKAFADNAFWSAYVDAIMNRRAAIDEYQHEHPQPTEVVDEAESERMFG